MPSAEPVREKPTVRMLPFPFPSRCSKKPNLMAMTKPACPMRLSRTSLLHPTRDYLSLSTPCFHPLLNEQIEAERPPNVQIKATHPSASLSISLSLPP
ncbi:hypothetical protein AMTRI_Chr04g184380 [Amborella trichopoda]